MIVVINREVWPLRMLFVCAVFCAFLNPESTVSAGLLSHGWPYFTVYLGLFYFFILPLLGVEWSLGHWLKGTVGTFLTFPVFGAFAIGIVVLNLILAPLQAASTGVTAYYLYHTFTPSMYRKIIGCPTNDPQCCDIVRSDIQGVESNSRFTDQSCAFPNSSLRFYEKIVNVDGKPNDHKEDLEISKPINWNYWLGILATFGIAFFVVAAGPMTFGFFALIYLLSIFGLLIAMAILLRFKEPTAGERWSYFSSTMEAGDWNVYKTKEAWDSILQTVFRFSALGMGIMPALANYNYPSNSRWYISDVITIMIILPAFLILEGILYINLKDHIPDHPRDWNFKFAVMPIVLQTLSQPRLWTALYFLMDFLRGTLSVAFSLEVINSCIMHLLAICTVLRKPVFYRPVISFLSSIILAFASIVYCAKGGVQLRDFVANYAHRFIPVFVVIEVLVLTIVVVYDLCLPKSRIYIGSRVRTCVRSFCIILLLLHAAVATYITYLLNRDTFEGKVNIVGWVVALLPLAVSVAAVPLMVAGVCCYGCISDDTSACAAACGPHFAREGENSWDEGDDEEFAMLEKYT